LYGLAKTALECGGETALAASMQVPAAAGSGSRLCRCVRGSEVSAMV
jgi:hypothetical protein